MFYLAAYAFMNIGAFAVVSHLSGKGERYQSIDDFAGLGAEAAADGRACSRSSCCR